jgi:hypothetical protein
MAVTPYVVVVLLVSDDAVCDTAMGPQPKEVEDLSTIPNWGDGQTVALLE